MCDTLSEIPTIFTFSWVVIHCSLAGCTEFACRLYTWLAMSVITKSDVDHMTAKCHAAYAPARDCAPPTDASFTTHPLRPSVDSSGKFLRGAIGERETASRTASRHAIDQKSHHRGVSGQLPLAALFVWEAGTAAFHVPPPRASADLDGLLSQPGLVVA